MRRLILCGLVLAGLALTALPARAETMYARVSTPVRADRSLSAATVGTLAQGEAVETVRQEGNYYLVSYKAQQGWVYFNKLTGQKPEDVASLLGGPATGQGIQLTELNAGGALRGLSPMAENYARTSNVPDWAVKAVEAMQGRAVSSKALEDFQREGRLGEYGEGVAR
jgi:hypothetical protein